MSSRHRRSRTPAPMNRSHCRGVRPGFEHRSHTHGRARRGGGGFQRGFRFRSSRPRRFFAEDARFFGTCGRVRGGGAQVRVEKRDASRRVSVASLRLVSSRKQRDISTALKVLVGVVGMDQFFRADDTDGRIATQEVRRIETGFAGDIDEVLEIPNLRDDSRNGRCRWRRDARRPRTFAPCQRRTRVAMMV